MATIVKRGKKYSVVYYYTDRDGKQQQKWEPPVSTKKEATRRKNQIEYQIDNGTFIPPSNVTVENFLNDFVELYGSKKWGLSAWTSNTGLIRNYILPLLAGKCVQDITPRTVDLFIHELQRTKPVESFRKSKQEFVTACTIEKIVKLMRTAFRQAVRWGLVGSNPFDNAVLPKREKKERAIWDVKTIRKALDECEDGRLFVALNLAFACSMRLGEITGLQWDCVDISDRAIASDDASIRIERELERVDQEAINALGNADIIMVFPRVMAQKSKTRLVLKKPKTDTSIRTVWIPKTLALILREWRQRQEAWKEFMGEDYVDYNLVLALENGRPCEDMIIGNAFARLKEKAGLPDVVFHSLRHSSTTYKLKINHGDIKATQGDTGHAGPEMVTKVYAHILDEDRKINAQKFEAAFYSNPDMRQIEAQSAQSSLPSATADLGGAHTSAARAARTGQHSGAAIERSGTGHHRIIRVNLISKNLRGLFESEKCVLIHFGKFPAGEKIYPRAICILWMRLYNKNAAILANYGKSGTPGATRTHYIPLRRRALYPGEVQGHVLNFPRMEDDLLIIRRRTLYPGEVQGLMA